MSVRADLAVTLAAGALIAAWDLSGADLALTRQLASSAGFAWRDAWLTRTLLHDGGRLLAGGVLASVVWHTWRGRAPPRADRWRALATVAATLLLVPALKRVSATSCPWDLAEFGGTAAYVPHWLPGIADGGPGHCFPSGHAVAAFAFFPLYFLWRERAPRRARAWLAGTLIAGVAFGAAQALRGAHFASHALWSGWLCWTLAVLAARGVRPQAVPAMPAPPAAAAPRPAPAAARPDRRGAGR